MWRSARLYASPSDSEDWGDDLLGQPDTVVNPDKAWRFWLQPGTYDLLVRDCQGQDLEQVNEVDLSAEPDLDAGRRRAGGETRATETSSPLRSTICRRCPYAASLSFRPRVREGGDNWLGSATLGTGQSKEFAVDAGSYDVWAEDCSNAYLGVLWAVEPA